MSLKVKERVSLILALSFYIVPILIFGDIIKVYQITALPLTSIVLYILSRKRETKYSPFVDSISIGLFLGIFHLDPFTTHLNKNLLEISISWVNILGYWISIIGYLICIGINRMIRYERILDEFERDPKRILRNSKIDKILSRF